MSALSKKNYYMATTFVRIMKELIPLNIKIQEIHNELILTSFKTPNPFDFSVNFEDLQKNTSTKKGEERQKKAVGNI